MQNGFKKIFSPFNIKGTGLNINPWQIGGSLLSGLRDSTNYNQSTTLENINEIGGSMLGNTLDAAGNIAISTGNPFAIAGGLASKAVGGIADTVSFLRRDLPEIQTNASGMDDRYDLGDEAVGISNMSSPKEVFRDTLKQTAASGLLALPLAFLAKGKAKRNERRAQEAFATAQSEFNAVDRNVDLQRHQLLQSLARKRDRY